MERRMNKGLQLYLLNRLIESIKVKLRKHLITDIDIEGDLDGVLDSYDNLLRYEENISNIKEAIIQKGYNLNFIDEEKIVKERGKDFNFLLKNLSLFKNKVFSLNCKIQKFTSERNFYEREYKKLLSIWRKLEYEIKKLPFEYPQHDIIDELLLMVNKGDSFASYSKEYKKRKEFKSKLIIIDPRIQKVAHILKLSEKDLMENFKQANESTLW